MNGSINGSGGTSNGTSIGVCGHICSSVFVSDGDATRSCVCSKEGGPSIGTAEFISSACPMIAITPVGPCDVSSNGLTGDVIVIRGLVMFAQAYHSF
jgi:hypothetical protein